jgi:hypothetical protein
MTYISLGGVRTLILSEPQSTKGHPMTTKMRKLHSRSWASALIYFQVVWVLAVTGTAEPSNSNSRGHPQSGIVGQVLLSGYCPHLRPGLDCSPRPLRSTIAVLSGNGKVIGNFTTDDEGMFLVNLKPGPYILVCIDPLLVLAPPVEVTVEHRQFTALTPTFDAGIR